MNIPENLLSIFLFALRIAVPLLGIVVSVRAFSSMRRGKRREEPVMVLEDMSTHNVISVLYWENSIGRSRSCDIVLRDQTASRAHAVLMRRESGWLISDTNSKAGTFVNGKKAGQQTPVLPGDVIAMGSTALMLKRTADVNGLPAARPPRGRSASPAGLLWSVSFLQLLLCAQVCFASGKVDILPLIPFGLLFFTEWIFYFISMKILGHVSFELETLGFLLSGIGVMQIAGVDVGTTYMQIAAMVGGIALFLFLIWFLGDLDRAMKWRVAVGALAILLFAANLLLAKERNGARNWISLGPVSLQPSEFIKIAFILVGTSTLDRLQTYKNLTGFIGFSAVCMGALFLMKDFGTACVFFVMFLIIAFMRSGSLRTISLSCSVAVLGAFLILKFKPYVAERFAAWGHVWQHVNDAGGYQQVRVLSYAASGGLFGVGIGKGSLKSVFASTSDLAFGMLCEEQGLVLTLMVLFVLLALALYARSDATRSRSTLYSISACTAGGMLLFQTCLHVFGATDVLPLTGVTLPFISLGGSSMASVWGMLALIKASDERTYAARRRRKK